MKDFALKYYVYLEKGIKSENVLETENVSRVIYFNAFLSLL